MFYFSRNSKRVVSFLREFHCERIFLKGRIVVVFIFKNKIVLEIIIVIRYE